MWTTLLHGSMAALPSPRAPWAMDLPACITLGVCGTRLSGQMRSAAGRYNPTKLIIDMSAISGTFQTCPFAGSSAATVLALNLPGDAHCPGVFHCPGVCVSVFWCMLFHCFRVLSSSDTLLRRHGAQWLTRIHFVSGAELWLLDRQ